MYHGLPGASVGENRSCSCLRGSSSISRRPQEERGRRRTDRSSERRRGPQARGRRPVGGQDEWSRSHLGWCQEQWRRAGEERAHPERTRGESPQESPFSKEEVASATGKEEIAAAISAVDSDCQLEG